MTKECDAVTDNKELSNRTHEEIFKSTNCQRRPLNFMNHSHIEYDLINNQARNKQHIEQFFNRRIDYNAQAKEIKQMYD